MAPNTERRYEMPKPPIHVKARRFYSDGNKTFNWLWRIEFHGLSLDELRELFERAKWYNKAERTQWREGLTYGIASVACALVPGGQEGSVFFSMAGIAAMMEDTDKRAAKLRAQQKRRLFAPVPLDEIPLFILPVVLDLTDSGRIEVDPSVKTKFELF
jgi:hypothetical protein